MNLLQAAGLQDRGLVSDVDKRMSVIMSSYSQAVDFVFNIVGISIDSTINLDEVITPLVKDRRRVSSPARSKSGSIGS